jgi:uncharacterized protein (TIGR03083 family)
VFQNSFERYNGEILAETAKIADLTTTDRLPEKVPTCPEWTSLQLIAHLGQALAWPFVLVGERHTEFVPPSGVSDGRDAWSDSVASLAKASDILLDPLRRSAQLIDLAHRLVSTLHEAGPDVPVWVPFGAKAARYWAHWTLFELSVHRADVELMLGRTASFQLAPELAIDLLDGFVTPLTKPETEPFFSPLRAGLRGNGDILFLEATDAPTEGHWLITLTPDGVEWTRARGTSDVSVRGRAADLLLLMKGRIKAEPPHLEVTGDARLIRHWQAHAIA